MNQQKMGEFLKHLRKDKGLTQEKLAEYFRVSSRTVSRWETGSNIDNNGITSYVVDDDVKAYIISELTMAIMMKYDPTRIPRERRH